jgi:hypothetical protein
MGSILHNLTPSKIVCFSTLPFDLRRQIIQHTYEPQLVKVTFYKSSGDSDVKVPLPPVALHINHDIRRESMQYYDTISIYDEIAKLNWPVFCFRPETDILKPLIHGWTERRILGPNVIYFMKRLSQRNEQNLSLTFDGFSAEQLRQTLRGPTPFTRPPN